MYLVSKTRPMHYIDDKGHKSKQQELFNQSYEILISATSYLWPWGWGHTHTHTYWHESDFKKLGAQPACAWFKQRMYSKQQFTKSTLRQVLMFYHLKTRCCVNTTRMQAK